MPSIATLLERSEALSLSPMPYISELATLGAPPIRTLVVTCADPRCIPETFFNLSPGEVIVHRNAGGNVRHALRDLLILDTLFQLEEVAIVHHTDCGTLQFTNEGLRKTLKEGVKDEHCADIDKIDFGANTDIKESVKDDLKWIEGNPLVRDGLKKGFQGFVFDIKTGKLEKVEAA